MTDTESIFRKYIKAACPDSYIKKLPDLKSHGHGAPSGLPDYLLIAEGTTVWWEVKKVSGDTLSHYHYTPAQLVNFKQMIDNGAVIMIYCFTKNCGRQIVPFEWFLTKKSLKFKKLD
jgi:hypothetical protein